MNVDSTYGDREDRRNCTTLGTIPLSEALELLDWYMDEVTTTSGWSRYYDTDNDIITWNLWKIKDSKRYAINVSVTTCMLQDSHPLTLGNMLERAKKELRDA